MVNSDDYLEFASNYYWVGENQYYGLGIFAKDDVKLELVDLDENDLYGFMKFIFEESGESIDDIVRG